MDATPSSPSFSSPHNSSSRQPLPQQPAAAAATEVGVVRGENEYNAVAAGSEPATAAESGCTEPVTQAYGKTVQQQHRQTTSLGDSPSDVQHLHNGNEKVGVRKEEQREQVILHEKAADRLDYHNVGKQLQERVYSGVQCKSSNIYPPTTMLASCAQSPDETGPGPRSLAPSSSSLAYQNSKARLRRIKAKYERQQQPQPHFSLFNYARFRELRNAKTRGRKVSTSDGSDNRHPNSSVKGQTEMKSQSERMAEIPVPRKGSVETKAERQTTNGERNDTHCTNNNSIPTSQTTTPLQQTPPTPETPPDVTSSTLDNEARLAQIAETLSVPHDPKQWSCEHVQQWIAMILDDFYSKHLATLTVDGALLCLLSKDQIQQRVPDFTTFMMDSLDHWKQESSKPKQPGMTSMELTSQPTQRAQPMKPMPSLELIHPSPKHSSISPSPAPAVMISPSPTPAVMNGWERKGPDHPIPTQPIEPIHLNHLQPYQASSSTTLTSSSLSIGLLSSSSSSSSIVPSITNGWGETTTTTTKHCSTNNNNNKDNNDNDGDDDRDLPAKADSNANYDRPSIPPPSPVYSINKRKQSEPRKDPRNQEESNGINGINAKSSFLDYKLKRVSESRNNGVVSQQERSRSVENRFSVHRTWSPEKRMTSPENQTQYPENKHQSVNHRTWSPVNKAQSENRTHSPESKEQLPDNRTWSPALQVKDSKKEESRESAMVHRQVSAASSEGELVIDEFANSDSLLSAPRSVDPAEAIRPSTLVLEEATDKEIEYVAKECSSNAVVGSITEKASVSSAGQSETIAPGQKRRKSENERLKGFAKKLKLKITPQNSLDRDDENRPENPSPSSKPFVPSQVFTQEAHSAPILSHAAYNKGYEDACKLKDMILKSKLAGLPFNFPPPLLLSPLALASSSSPLAIASPSLVSVSASSPFNPSRTPKFELPSPSPNMSLLPSPLRSSTMHSPHTPTSQNTTPLTPVNRSPLLRRPSPLAAMTPVKNESDGLSGQVAVKEEPVSPRSITSMSGGSLSSAKFLTIPRSGQSAFFRTPSPLRSPSIPVPQQNGFFRGMSEYGSKHNGFSGSGSIGSRFSGAGTGFRGDCHDHDQDIPLDLSSDSKPKPDSKPDPDTKFHLSSIRYIPTPSPLTIPHRFLLPRSYSMPLGSDAAASDSPLPLESSVGPSGTSLIHPLALSGSCFTQGMPSSPVVVTPDQQHPGAGGAAGGQGSSGSGMSSGYMSMSSVEGDSDPTSETETPNGIGHVAKPKFPVSPLASAGSSSSGSSPPSTGINRVGRIKLWEFLLELLDDRDQSCITWLSQHQGVFKILNSEQVANLWGKRKGLSSMNYDKLSRSIRQYYKQGIIQKTHDSKRLVYQFDPKYIDMHNARYNKFYTNPRGGSISISGSSGGRGGEMINNGGVGSLQVWK